MPALAARSATPSATRLRPALVAPARLGWLAITGLGMLLFALALPARFDLLLDRAAAMEPALVALGLSLQFYAAFHVGLELTFTLGYLVVAATIFLARSDDWMALLIALMLATAATMFPATIDVLVNQGTIWSRLVLAVSGIAFTVNAAALLLFPDGRFVPGWSRWFWLGWAAFTLSWAILPALSLFYLPPLVWLMLQISWSGAGLAAQFHRYRRVSTPTQRLQTRWAISGASVAVLVILVTNGLKVLDPALASPGAAGVIFTLIASPIRAGAMLLIPLTIAIGILRHRLYDIDLIINRALVYSLLTGLLALGYVASVVLLENLFRFVLADVFQVGLAQRSDLAIVISTLAMAALFNPLRRRVQAFIDRRFYREKYDATRTLATFNARLRDRVDLATPGDELVEVVRETMRPGQISLWVRPTAARADEHVQPGATLAKLDKTVYN